MLWSESDPSDEPLSRAEAIQKGNAMYEALQTALRELTHDSLPRRDEPHPVLAILVVGPYAKAINEQHPSLYPYSELYYYPIYSSLETGSFDYDLFACAKTVFESKEYKFPQIELQKALVLGGQNLQSWESALLHLLEPRHRGSYVLIKP